MKLALSLHIHASVDAMADRQHVQECFTNIFAKHQLRCDAERHDNSIPRLSPCGADQHHIFILGSKLSPTDEVTWPLRLQKIAENHQSQHVYLLRQQGNRSNDGTSAQLDHFCLRHFFNPDRHLATQLHFFSNQSELEAIAHHLGDKWLMPRPLPGQHQPPVPFSHSRITGSRLLTLTIALGLLALVCFFFAQNGEEPQPWNRSLEGASVTHSKSMTAPQQPRASHDSITPNETHHLSLARNQIISELNNEIHRIQQMRAWIPPDFQCTTSSRGTSTSQWFAHMAPRTSGLFMPCLVTLDAQRQQIEYCETWNVPQTIDRMIIAKPENRALIISTTPNDSLLELRELPTWKLLHTNENLNNQANLVVFSQDGLLYTDTYDDHHEVFLRVCDSRTGETLTRLPMAGFQSPVITCHLNSQRLRLLFADASLLDFAIASNRPHLESHLPFFEKISSASFDASGSLLFSDHLTWQLCNTLADPPVLITSASAPPEQSLIEQRNKLTSNDHILKLNDQNLTRDWSESEVEQGRVILKQLREKIHASDSFPLTEESLKLIEKCFGAGGAELVITCLESQNHADDWQALWHSIAQHKLSTIERHRILDQTEMMTSSWRSSWIIQQALADTVANQTDDLTPFLSALGYDSTHLSAFFNRYDSRQTRLYRDALTTLPQQTWKTLDALCWLHECKNAETLALKLLQTKPISPNLMFVIFQHPFLLRQDLIARALQENVIFNNDAPLWECWVNQEIQQSNSWQTLQSLRLYLKYQPAFNPYMAQLLSSAWDITRRDRLELLLKKNSQIPPLIAEAALIQLTWPDQSSICFDLWQKSKPTAPEWQKIRRSYPFADTLIALAEKQYDILQQSLIEIAVTEHDDYSQIEKKIALILSDTSLARYGASTLRQQCLRAIKACAAMNRAPAHAEQLVTKAMHLGAEPIACQRAMCQLASSQHDDELAYHRWLDLINQYSPTRLLADDFIEAANAAIQSGKWTEATQLLGAGYAYFSHNSSYLCEAAWLLINLQKPEPALKYLQEAKAQGFDDDRSTEHQVALALAFFQNGQIDAAVDCYREFLSRQKNLTFEIDQLQWPEEFKEQMRTVAKVLSTRTQ